MRGQSGFGGWFIGRVTEHVGQAQRLQLTVVGHLWTEQKWGAKAVRTGAPGDSQAAKGQGGF